MTSSEKELEQQLMDAGNKLLEPPESVDELLPLLDQVESYLSRVDQSPSKTMQNALSPSQKALVADQLFKHSEVDVKIAVASCISEITRITAPDAPFDDDQMKEVFQLIVSSFENLSDKSSRSYAKRTSILETVAKVRSCVVMLDLECEALIIEMFQRFLKEIRVDHSENVFSSMETIMNLVLEESEEIAPELLSPILDCVIKDNEEVLPIARKLGEKVLQSCAAKVKPYLLQAVKSSGISLDDYSEVVASICQEASVVVEQNDVHVSNERKTDEDKSKSANSPPDEAAQVDKEIVTEAASTEQVDPADNRSPKSIVNNGTTQTVEDDSLADSNALKKEEPDNLLDQSKGVKTVNNAEPDSSITDKVVSAEDKSEQTTKRKGKKPNSSMKSEELVSNAEPDSSITDKVVSAEDKPEQTTKRKGKKPNSSMKSEELSLADSNVLKKEEPDSILDQSKGVKTVSNAEPDSSVVDKVVIAEDKSEQTTKRKGKKPNSSMKSEELSLADSNALKKKEPGNLLDQYKGVKTVSNAEPDSSAADKLGSAEDKPEQTTKSKGKKPNSSMKSEEPSDSSQIDGEKETEVVLDHKSDSKEVPSSPHEEPTAEGNVSSENEKETGIQVSFPKATEGESMDVVSPFRSESVPIESRAQRHGRSKKKDVLLKEGTFSADDVSKKASEGTSDSETKPLKLSGKKVPAGSANEDITPTAYISKKEASSDSEGKLLKQSAKKVDTSSNNGDLSSKQSHDKKRHEKATPGKDATRSLTRDDKEMVSSPKSSAKPTKDEQHFEATSKSNSKRKRTPGNEKASDTEDLGENLVGSKVKVWWPKDRIFYGGVIESFDPVKKKHKVSYFDGDEENLNLKRERWEFIGGDSDSEEEQAADRESPDASSEMPLKKKLKTSAEQSAKQGKLENSPKKGGGASSSKSKVGDANSSHKSKDEVKVDGKSKDGSKTKLENDNVGKNKDHTSKSGSKSVDVASKSSSKSKNAMDTSKSGKSNEGGSGTPKTSSKSKQETPKSSKSKQETPKISSNAKGKSPNIVGKSNANGTGKSKSNSKKVREDEDEDVQDSTDSIEVPENTKGKSSSPSKTPASEAKSGKKRRRVSKS